jgi:hypothetical protein
MTGPPYALEILTVTTDFNESTFYDAPPTILTVTETIFNETTHLWVTGFSWSAIPAYTLIDLYVTEASSFWTLTATFNTYDTFTPTSYSFQYRYIV